ncbi:MAG: radical SAM protein, partial [Candidatus Sericytochromatia bacterium]
MGSELWRRQGSPAAPQAVLSARRESLSLTQGRDKVYTFDSEGRPISFFIAGDFYQRGLGNTLLHKGRSQDQRFRQLLPPDQAESLLLQVWQEAAALGPELPAGEARQVLERILAWTPAKLAAEGRRFDEIYRPISILPPDQYLSLVLQLSEGCSYNRCSFCDFYKTRPFRIKSVQAFREHVQAVREFLGAGASLRKGIFLADGDALMTPQPRLRECIGVLRETYPALPLYSFMDAFRPQAKSAAEFSELAQLGLKRVYLGIETGDAALLQWLAKPGNPQLM